MKRIACFLTFPGEDWLVVWLPYFPLACVMCIMNADYGHHSLRCCFCLVVLLHFGFELQKCQKVTVMGKEDTSLLDLSTLR